ERAEQQREAGAAAFDLEPILDAGGDGFRRRETGQVAQQLERRAQGLPAPGAGTAGIEVGADLLHLGRTQVAVAVSREPAADEEAPHEPSSRSPSIGSKRRRSASRARARRLLTVPSGRPRVAATSSHDKHSTSLNNKIARCSNDRPASACWTRRACS